MAILLTPYIQVGFSNFYVISFLGIWGTKGGYGATQKLKLPKSRHCGLTARYPVMYCYFPLQYLWFYLRYLLFYSLMCWACQLLSLEFLHSSITLSLAAKIPSYSERRLLEPSVRSLKRMNVARPVPAPVYC